MSSGICYAAMTSILMAKANAASMKVSNRVIAMSRNRNPARRGSASKPDGRLDAISSARLFMQLAILPQWEASL